MTTKDIYNFRINIIMFNFFNIEMLHNEQYIVYCMIIRNILNADWKGGQYKEDGR